MRIPTRPEKVNDHHKQQEERPTAATKTTTSAVKDNLYCNCKRVRKAQFDAADPISKARLGACSLKPKHTQQLAAS